MKRLVAVLGILLIFSIILSTATCIAHASFPTTSDKVTASIEVSNLPFSSMDNVTQPPPPVQRNLVTTQAALFTGTLASMIQTAQNEVASAGGGWNWNSLSGNGYGADSASMQAALMLGINTTQQINSFLDSCRYTATSGIDPHLGSGYMGVNYLKYLDDLRTISGVVPNQTTIRWALDNVTIMANGLPMNYYTGSATVFATYYRSTLSGFYYAQLYSYDTAKWDINKAYNTFHQIVIGNSAPVLWVYSNNQVYNAGRYYDEYAETMDTFLRFYEMGIPQALADANTVWSWINTRLWFTNHYGYTTDGTYECEAGGFYPIVMHYLHDNPSAQYIDRIATDIQSRFLNTQWNSPQWTYQTYPSSYAVVHDHETNAQIRLVNTEMAWQSIAGYRSLLPSTAQTNYDVLLSGTGTINPAWMQLVNNSTLYLGTPGFTNYNGQQATNWATAQTIGLLILQGIIPVGTASTAVSINENQYNTVNYDPDLYAFNFATNSIVFSVQQPGQFTFIYGTTPVTGTFTQQGIYSVQFSSDFNTITSSTWLNPLPTNKIYMAQTLPSPAASIAVSGFPATSTAGTVHSVTVTAYDASGNVATSFSGTVTFTSTDKIAVLPAPATLTAGTGTFSVTLKTTGTQSITATSGALTASQTGIQVTPASTSAFTVAGFPTPITAGTTGSITVTAKDAYGNSVTTYAGTIRFSSNDIQATLPANYAFTTTDAGTKTFIGVILKTATTTGSITATDTTTGSITGSQTSITVNPASAATLTVSGYPNPTSAGAAHSVTVTALDSYGNVATGSAGQVTITSTDPAATLPAPATLTKGTGTFTVTLNTAGTQSIIATSSSLTGAQTGIQVQQLKTLSVTVTTNKSTYQRGSTQTVQITVTVKDSVSQTPLSGARVTTTITTPSNQVVNVGTSTTNSNGVATFTYTLSRYASTGTYQVTATATISSYISSSGKTTFTVR